MSSLSNINSFSRSMNGLNNINANSINTDNLSVNTLSILNSGTAPTMTSTDNSNHISTTAYVQNAISSAGSNYVSLNTPQTITATKTYTIVQNIPTIKGQYIDLFAGQLRMFSGSTGGSAIYFYVPPSGRSIMDFSSTNCDMVGQYNLTSNNITCSIAPSSANEYTNKNYVDTAITGGLSGYMNLTTAQTANGDKTFNGITTFENSVIANFQITNNDIASFQNGAFFDNVCPYSTVPPTGSQDLTRKDYVDNAISTAGSNYVNLTGTQTITGTKTFNNLAINQSTGDVNITLNSSTQKVNIIRGTNTINFSTNAGPALNSSSTTTPFIISAGSGTTSAGFNLNPTGGLGEGGEMIIGSTAYCGKNLWIDGTNGGLKSFGSNNIRIYNPFSYSYNPSTITWGSPSSNTINGWTNSPTNVGQTYSGTASDNSTPANVGQIVLPSPGIWFLQVSALITLNTGSDTITDRTIVVSDIGTTDNSPCTVGFAYRDPIDDGAGSAGNRQIVNFSGIYHFVDVSSGTRPLYINAIVITSGSRTVTVSGNYKYTRIG